MARSDDIRHEALRALRACGLDPRLLDAVSLDDEGAGRTISALAAADGRDGARALWAGVAVAALGLHQALHAVAHASLPTATALDAVADERSPAATALDAGVDASFPAAAPLDAGVDASVPTATPLDAVTLLDEMFVAPLERLPDARAGLLVAEARRGSLAVQAPTGLHRELAVSCAGGGEPARWRDAVTAWARTRDAADAADELQAWGLPALPAGRPQPAPATPCAARAEAGQRADPAAAGQRADLAGAGQRAHPTAAAHRADLAGARQRAHPTAAARGQAREAADRSPPAPLAGVRVVELGGLWAAPYATLLLGRLGAEVVKVEAPMRPDGARAGSPAHFSALNDGKRLARLDLRREDDRAAFLALLGPGTVVVENFTGRVLPNLRLGPDLLLAHGAALVRLPASRARPDLRGLGSSIELAAGLGRSGPRRGLTCAPIPFTDALAGVSAALHAVAALHRGPRLQVVGQLEDVARHVVPRAAPAGMAASR